MLDSLNFFGVEDLTGKERTKNSEGFSALFFRLKIGRAKHSTDKERSQNPSIDKRRVLGFPP
jgi:hypothetical protein